MESEASHGPPILPADLVTEILLKLPVKSLLKFRSVSKSWLDVISSSEFINTHLSISSNNKDNNRHRLMLTCDQPKYSLKDCSVSSLLYDSVTETLDLEFPWISTRNSVRFVGSVNGLICVSIAEKNLFIWNPSIRKYKKLPDFSYATLCLDDHFMYGFGYDEVRDDYKVVVGLYNKKKSVYGLFLVEVKLYSLISDSWTSIEDFESRFLATDSGMFVNGKFHWANRTADSLSGWDIVSIDLADRKWGKLEEPCYEEGCFYLMLGVLGGDLSVICNYHIIRADVWVMKEYGVKESWMKMFTIYLPSDIIEYHFCPFFCRTNKGEILFELGTTFMIYNPKDDSIMYSAVVNCEAFYEASIYIESMVWPYKRGLKKL